MKRFCSVIVFIGLFVPATASALQIGTYRCASYNVSGGGGSCRLASPIVINADGTYKESSTTGNYRVSGDRIEFSQSTIRGPGTISGNQIHFEYDYRGWRHSVTYACQDCSAATPGGRLPPAAAARGAPVWVQVRMAFQRPDGFLGWANSAHLVPVEAAAGFAAAAGASPPPGSATGSAYADRDNVVVGNFRQATGGRDYVVFLDSGRERIAVGRLHLPAAPSEQTLSIDAALNFSSSADAGKPTASEPPRIGVEIVDITPEIAKAVGFPGLRGTGVRRVIPGGPAEQAGVQAGDIIVAVNDEPVAKIQELHKALEHRRSGTASKLSVFRAGRLIAIVVP